MTENSISTHDRGGSRAPLATLVFAAWIAAVLAGYLWQFRDFAAPLIALLR